MGIPTYFRFLMEKYKGIVVETPKRQCDYFFLDFNSILYKVFYDNERNKLNEEFFLYNICEEVKRLCNDEIQPKKLIYFSLDGPCPRAKMVQQRSRRYKSIQIQNLLEKKDDWNPSNNICPGTNFMYKFKMYLLKQMEKKVFHCPEVILSDSSFPGEGEHKILPLIRKLKEKDPNGNIIIMSPDNDLISLGILTGKSNIYILRYIDYMTAELLKKDNYNKNSLIYIDLDILRREFQKESSKEGVKVDEMNILLDYNFLLSMVGNDFIPVLPYLKIKNGGLDRLIRLYHQIFKEKKEYLIHKETLDINIPFFTELILILSKMENNDWNNLNLFIKKEQSGYQVPRNEDNLSKEKIYENRLNHLYMANPYHPLFELYKDEFEKIPFHLSKHEWKPVYYEYFCNIKKDNYNKVRNNMVFEYLKSLKFTLFYYNRKCPSWSWYYPYRVAPLFSDIYTNISKFNLDINRDIRFNEGRPYTPFQQLMFILPPQSREIVPKPLQLIFEKYKEYYPTEFRVDALQGLKYIYSEAILPEWDCFLELLEEIKSLEKKISPKEKERNKIHFQLYRM